MNRVIEVSRKDGGISSVAVGDVLGSLSEWLPKGKRVIIITDSNLHRAYPKLINSYEHIIIGLGETNKRLFTVERICDQLIAMGADRGCFILGVGGGIVTDITGFVASIYMRGVRFGFIATSLLAQVDASIGGKNGVNIDGYKNMVGVFNQPEFVLCDTSVLKTLETKEFIAGMAEIIKAAIITDFSLFEKLEKYDIETLKSNPELLMEVITASLQVKADIVTEDETEQGVRKKLNLGHTFAHAVEKTTRDHLHGEAVSIGVVIMANMALKMGMITIEYRDRIVALLERYELPVKCDLSMNVLLKALTSDKKRDSDSISIILPSGLGSCDIVKMSFTELNAHFEA